MDDSKPPPRKRGPRTPKVPEIPIGAMSDRRIMRRLGETLFGGRWKRDMAAFLGVSPALIYAIAEGSRIVSPEIRERMRQACDAEVVRLRQLYETRAGCCMDVSSALGLKISEGVRSDEPLKPRKDAKTEGDE